DISFFRRVKLTITDDGILTVEFYAAGVYRIAVNDVDERALRGLLDLWAPWLVNRQQRNSSLSVATVRSWREKTKFGAEEIHFGRTPETPTDITLMPTEATLQFARECVRERLLAG